MTAGGPEWERVDALFTRALELPLADREAFLDEACGGDAALRAAVEDLLALDSSAEEAGFLARSAQVTWEPLWEQAARDRSGEADPATDRQGERVGPYRLEEEIGRGGMASVYRARRVDGAFEQEVAVKVVRPGLAAERLVQRLRAEREILSGLTHPNIARLLDGGTTDDGLPFLVLELVEGRPITTHADERGLGLRARLELFLEVVEAVEHAHRNLILHRDLKPSNILVTDEGRVRLLDFGIAKLLDPDADPDLTLTRVGTGPLTPDYASPEQIRAEPVTTASDTYQLGVLLYRLLAGVRPYTLDTGSPVALMRSFEERALRPPSQACDPATPDHPVDPTTLRGDLDTIVLKALREDPDARYPSAALLADDIRRFLADQPVLARPPRWSYRARKFLKRNRWFGPAVAILALALLGYGWTLYRHNAELERERNLARAEAAKAREVQAFLVDLFRRSDPFGEDLERSGADITMARALGLGMERARSELDDRPALRATLLGTISEANANLDLEEQALEAQRAALEAAREAADTTLLLDALDGLATRLWQRGSLAAADSVYRTEYLPLAGSYDGPDSPEVARGLMGLGNVLSSMSELEAAEAALDSAAALFERASDARETERAEVFHNLANLRNTLGLHEEAEAAARRAVAIRETLSGPDHPHTAVALTALASALVHQSRYEEAMGAEERALTIFERRLGPSHGYTLNTRNNLAVHAAEAGDYETAIRQHRRILEVRRTEYGPESAPVAASLQNLGAALLRAGRPEEAAPLARQAHEIYRELRGPRHFRTALPLLTLAEIQLDREAWAEALSTAREASSILEDALPEGHYVAAVALGRVGRALAGLGRADEAAPLLRSSLASLRSAEADTDRYIGEMQAALDRLGG